MKKLLIYLILCSFVLVPSGFAQTPQDDYKSGKGFEERGRFDLAIMEYNKAIKNDPQYADAYLQRGHAHYMLEGNYEKAIADYSKAIQVNPRYVKSYQYRAFAYRQSGKPHKALTDLNRAIEIDRTDGYSHFQRGLVYYDLKEYEKAWADLKKGEKFAPPGLIKSLKKAAKE